MEKKGAKKRKTLPSSPYNPTLSNYMHRRSVAEKRGCLKPQSPRGCSPTSRLLPTHVSVISPFFSTRPNSLHPLPLAAAMYGYDSIN